MLKTIMTPFRSMTRTKIALFAIPILATIIVVATIPPVFAQPIEVEIDVKPGSDPNSVNTNSKGVLPVAILGSENFDATQIDQASITAFTISVDAFVDAWIATPLRCSIGDVDDDGILDLNCKFSKEGLMLDCWTNGIIVSGNSLDGTPFIGSDAIRPVPCD